MADEDFSPETHRFAPPRYFDDFHARLEPGRTTGVVAMHVTIHNQDKELVMHGEHRYLLRRQP